MKAFNCSSASAAALSFANRSILILFTSELVMPFFCNFFFALSVASKNCPSCLLRPAKDCPALMPNLIDESKLMGSIFYLPSDIVGRLARNSKEFSKVLTLDCSLTIAII